jgi:hypothetical protein
LNNPFDFFKNQMNDQNITLYMGLRDETNPNLTTSISITEAGLIFKENTTRAEWREIGMILSRAATASTRWVASWRKYGFGAFGEEIVELETGQLCFPSVVTAQAKQLEMLPEEVFAQGNIGPGHAKVLVEACDSPLDQARWAKVAIKEGLTPGELRASIEEGKVVRRSDDEKKGGGSISSIHGVRGLYDRWAATTLKERPLDEWHPEDLRALLDELKPIYLLCEMAAAIWKANRQEVSTGGNK